MFQHAIRIAHRDDAQADSVVEHVRRYHGIQGKDLDG